MNDGPGSLTVNFGRTRVSPDSVITVARADPVPSGLNTARWCRRAQTSREQPTIPLRLIMTAAKTVSRARVEAWSEPLTIRVTMSATSMMVTATARIREPTGSPTRWAITSAWCTAASTAPTRKTPTTVTATGPSAWVVHATTRTTSEARGTSVVHRSTLRP